MLAGTVTLSATFVIAAVAYPLAHAVPSRRVDDAGRRRTMPRVHHPNDDVLSYRTTKRRPAGVSRLGRDRAASVLDLRALQRCAWHEPAMTTAHSRALRCAMAVVIAALPQCGVPAARAVSPPPIDSSRLPEPAPARPTQPTVQREICAVPSITPDADRANALGQFSGLDLPQVWKLTRGSGQRVAVIDTGVAPHSRLPAHGGRRGLCVHR